MQQSTIRKLDFQNRITLPKSMTNFLSLEPEDEVIITLEKQRIVIDFVKHYCVFCGNEATKELNGKPVCEKCVAKIKNS